MEFQYEERICSFQNICAGSMAESDDEETLSFCDMLLCDSAELACTQRESNPDSSDIKISISTWILAAPFPRHAKPLLQMT
ncbi:hypothetical protein SUGI_0904870 [Cryptomeria japonica]|nr:hypothetical protein SUGI_0904870 [Cryptomeria japonica]